VLTLAGTADSPHELYLARGADLADAPDPNEAEAVRWVPLAEIPGLIAKGEIIGAATIIAVQHVLLTAAPPARWSRTCGWSAYRARRRRRSSRYRMLRQNRSPEAMPMALTPTPAAQASSTWPCWARAAPSRARLKARPRT